MRDLSQKPCELVTHSNTAGLQSRAPGQKPESKAAHCTCPLTWTPEKATPQDRAGQQLARGNTRCTKSLGDSELTENVLCPEGGDVQLLKLQSEQGGSFAKCPLQSHGDLELPCHAP